MNAEPSVSSPPQVSCLQRSLTLFRVFASISAVALGGGLVMLPVMQREFVERRGWMSNDDMLDTVALMQSLPGIIAVNMGSLIGYRIAGVAGAIAGVLGVVLPPFLTIVAIAYFLLNVFDYPAVQHAFTGIRAGVCAMILMSVIKMAKSSLKSAFAACVALGGFLTLLLCDINVIILIVAGALAGLLAAGYSAWRARRLAATAQGGTKA